LPRVHRFGDHSHDAGSTALDACVGAGSFAAGFVSARGSKSTENF
jgi:hypothetical protein